MEEVNAKNPKETACDRHLKCINFYSSKNYGISVQCTECKKIRKTFLYRESHEVPEKWCCPMLILENGEKGSCNDPEDKIDEQCPEYCPGSVVWAKLNGYPWWPGMVDGDPDTGEFSRKVKNTVYYNVTFLEEKATHAWIHQAFICPFLKPPEVAKGTLQKFKQNRYAKAISKAKERAEAAMKLTIKDRLETYSFVHLYKRRLDAVSKFEKHDKAEKKSRKTQGLIFTCDDKNKKDFIAKGNNLAEEENISETPGIVCLKDKAYNIKCADNEDFIPEREVEFLFMRKISSEHSNSFNMTLSNKEYQNLIECGENINNSLKASDGTGIIRYGNRKFTPRKVKTFDKTTSSFFDSENTDSGNESDETVIYHEEDSNKTIHRAFDEYPNSKKRKIVKVSDDLQKEIANQDKLKTSFENTNHRTDKLEENVTNSAKVCPETKVLQNVCVSVSDCNGLNLTDRQTEKYFNEKEDKITTKDNIISKKSNLPCFKKKTHHAKYLNKEHLIPNEISPLIKRKRSENPFSINNSLSKGKHQISEKCVKTIAKPIEKQKDEEADEKTIRKKPKKAEISTDSLTGEIPVLGSGVSKNKASKTIAVSSLKKKNCKDLSSVKNQLSNFRGIFRKYKQSYSGEQ